MCQVILDVVKMVKNNTTENISFDITCHRYKIYHESHIGFRDIAQVRNLVIRAKIKVVQGCKKI